MLRVVVVALCGAFSLGPAMAADPHVGGGGFGFTAPDGYLVARPGTTVPAEVDSSQILGATFISAAVGTAATVAPFSALEPQRLVSIAPSERIELHTEIPPQFLRQEVVYDGPERPGVVVIDTPRKFLFLVEPGGRAIRYGIGVGRPGFEWAGVKRISRKAEWPDWTAPSEMTLRRPDLPTQMAGGPDNPLGARAMYLGSSLYRIHGTNEPWSIGQNVSSGCIRMMNDDVIDLYGRVKVGTRVIVM